MRILLVSLLYPLPTNAARGTFVADHALALKKEGHDVRVVNTLPRMLRYQEARRSTLTGVAKAPKSFEHGGLDVFAPRFTALPEHPLPSLTKWSMRRMARPIEAWLGDWRPETIVCHTLWPAGVLANHLARRWNIPWSAVVHGWDIDVGLDHSSVGAHLAQLIKAPNRLVAVSSRLEQRVLEVGREPATLSMIPCHMAVEDEWLKPMRPSKKRWRRSKLDLLFPADPRRPEKNHMLALRCGEVLEHRGWIIGITTLKQQPRPIVWDRMLVADLTLITSKRESGPLVAKESMACGTPVVSLNVGDVAEFLPPICVVEEATAEGLADACEAALKHKWEQGFDLPERFTQPHVMAQWNELLQDLVA
ncbi:MAG: glycosyltransferase [Candidatus Poseidoniaceae archaeon]|nr:glycosyltransferase [Candidatus Poseidoniaceae archaeon]